MVTTDGTAAVLQRNFGWLTPDQATSYAVRLVRIADKLSQLDVEYCNRDLTLREWSLRTRLEGQFLAITGELGIVGERNCDPRGYSIYLHLPEGDSNTWRGTERGYGI